MRLVNLELRFANLPRELDGLTILHLSDLHTKKVGTLEKTASSIISKLTYDLCVISGDLTTKAKWIKSVRQILGPNIQNRPAYVALGNSEHKHWVKTGDILNALEQNSFITLVNDSAVFEKNGKHINILGIDDAYSGLQNVTKAFEKVKPDCFTIALSHCPSAAEDLIRAGASLVLSGHTHGGQVRFPGIGVIWSHMHRNKFLNDGLYTSDVLSELLNTDIKDSILYVNRGLGTSRLHIRLHCNPEITLITLRSIEKQDQ